MNVPTGFPTPLSYEVGDTIAYVPFGGGTRLVRVTNKEADVAKGQPGFDGILVNEEGKPLTLATDSGVWGYDSQITYVVKREVTA